MKVARYQISWRSLMVAIIVFVGVFLVGIYIGESWHDARPAETASL